MTTILRPGRAGHEVECTGRGNGGGGCGALLLVPRDDMRYYEGGGYLDRDPAVVVRCPVCKALTDLEEGKWPQRPRELREFTSEWMRHGPNGGDEL